MDEIFSADAFEAERARLRAMAYRMLGSLGEAEDAVQEAWLRLTRAGGEGIGNLAAWLTTVTARICLDMLRARRARREEQLQDPESDPAHAPQTAADPEEEALMAEAVGHAVLVVLDRLSPAERVAFVLHDVFDMPFEEIAPIVGRSHDATRQLASRGRRRVRGAPVPEGDIRTQRATVEAWLAATRAGDLERVLAILDPDVVLNVDAALMPNRLPDTVHGAAAVSRRALGYPARARASALAVIDGRPGVVTAPRGRLSGVLLLTIEAGRITAIEAVGDPARLAKLDITLPS